MATTIAAWAFIFLRMIEMVGAFRADAVGAKIWSFILGALASAS